MTEIPGFLLQTAPRGPAGPHGPMGPNPGPHPMPYGGPGGGTMPWEVAGTGLYPALLWLLVLVAVVALLAYLAVRLLDGLPAGAGAADVLERRYARGEIDDEEFERRRDRLGAGP